MARYEGVSASVIRRLPRYYRFLYDLIQRDVHRISSRELAELMNLTASQIRQDLNCFGGFGQQGYGYNVDALYEEIGNILGQNKGRKIILLGAGNLGMALVKHLSFEAKGFRMIGIFDKNPKLIGQKIHGIEIMPESELESFCQKNKPDAAVLCLPKDVVEELGDRLISYGIRAFWNFSHYDLGLRHRDKGTPIVVENVHLGDSLMTLCYQVNDVLDAMSADSGIRLSTLKVDGGAAANNYLLQTQADISNAPVERPSSVETTALGAAYLAGLAVGFWSGPEELAKKHAIDKMFVPDISEEERRKRLRGWHKAVRCAYNWARDDDEDE